MQICPSGACARVISSNTPAHTHSSGLRSSPSLIYACEARSYQGARPLIFHFSPLKWLRYKKVHPNIKVSPERGVEIRAVAF